MSENGSVNGAGEKLKPNLNVFANDDRKLPADEVKNESGDDEDGARSGAVNEDEEEEDEDEDSGQSSNDVSAGGYGDASGGYGGMYGQGQQRETPFDRLRRKAQLLARLERKQRSQGAHFIIPPDASLRQLEELDAKVTYEARAEHTVRMYKRVFMFIVAQWEATTKRFPGIGLDLDKFTEEVFLQIDGYDEDFFDVYDMYGAHRVLNPFVRIAFSLLTSSLAYSMSRKMLADPYAAHPQAAANAPPVAQPSAPAPLMSSSVDELLQMRTPEIVPRRVDHHRPVFNHSTAMPAVPEVNDDNNDDEFGPMPAIEQLRMREDAERKQQEPADQGIDLPPAPPAQRRRPGRAARGRPRASVNVSNGEQ
jgi:hypothetical protein